MVLNFGKVGGSEKIKLKTSSRADFFEISLKVYFLEEKKYKGYPFKMNPDQICRKFFHNLLEVRLIYKGFLCKLEGNFKLFGELFFGSIHFY